MELFFEPESSSSAVEDAASPRSLSPSPTNEGNYQDIYDDPRPSAPRQYSYVQSPSEQSVSPDVSVRAYVGSRMSTASIAQSPDGSRLVIGGKDTLRILRVEDADAQQPAGYMNFSPAPSPLIPNADPTNIPGQRTSRTYAAAAAPDFSENQTASKFSQRNRRGAKILSRSSGPNDSVVYEDVNLWVGVGAKLGFQSSIVDVEWGHQNLSNIIVTAFGAGELVTWDLNKGTGSKVDKSAREAHLRAINCIRTTPIVPTALLTASQDGFVRFWDLRSLKSAVVGSPQPGISARSLAFSPSLDSAQQVLVGQEGGVLLRYDLRKPKQPLDRLSTAHSSAILSIDWQSVGNGNTSGWAATGGMDKTVKIWDMSTPQISTMPIHTLHTTHSVKQVAWRPGHETELAVVHMTSGIATQKGNVLGGTTSLAGIDMSLQIHGHGAKTPMLSSSPASHYALRGHRQRALSHSESIVTSNSAENLVQLGAAYASQSIGYDGDPDRIEIWDVRRNWVAKYVIGDAVADGSVTELVWPYGVNRPGSVLWASYASGIFAQHDLRNVFRPLDSIPRSGITWETRGVIAFAVDAVERGEIPYDDVRPDAKLLFASRGGRDKSITDSPYVPRTQVKGSVPIPSFELGVFVKLARGYILEGCPRDEICLHNAQVALEAGQYRASQAWHMLRGLLTPIVPEGPAPPQTDVTNEYSGRSHPVKLPSAHTPSPRSNQGSRAPSSGPIHGSLSRKSQSPRRKHPAGRSRRPTASRHASRGSGSGSGRSRPTTRSRSVSVDSNSSLKHVGGGALEDESDSSDGDIAESESEAGQSSSKVVSPISASGNISARPYPLSLSRRVRNTELRTTPRLTVFNEADEHNLSLMGGESSDDHLPTDAEPLHNSPTSDLDASEPDVDTEPDLPGPSAISLATLRADTANTRSLLRRQDSRSSVGTAKPSSLHPDDPQNNHAQHRRVRSGDGHQPSPATSRTHSLPTNKNRKISEGEVQKTRLGSNAGNLTYYSDRGDLQMSAMMSAVGGVELGIPGLAHERLVDAYLDMLSRLRLYAPAAYVRKYARSGYGRQATTVSS
ncbi:WD domain, G-beta repeat protein [Ceratobasidium sp. AG-Ba]|nr:WD domain, G-beta repeat protein [Ceratobasidium sp. AG-Ba]